MSTEEQMRAMARKVLDALPAHNDRSVSLLMTAKNEGVTTSVLVSPAGIRKATQHFDGTNASDTLAEALSWARSTPDIRREELLRQINAAQAKLDALDSVQSEGA